MIRCSKCGKDGVTAWQFHRCETEKVTVAPKVADMIHTTSEPIPVEAARSLPRRSHRVMAPALAPEAPRSSARSPNRRKPDTAHTQDRPAQQTSSCEEALRDTRSPASPGTPDTAPSVITLPDLTVITDAEFRVCYNAVMREKMRRRRAQGYALGYCAPDTVAE